MKKEEVIKKVAASQDGGSLLPTTTYSVFILNQIDENTNESGEVDIESLCLDFNYMRKELEKAAKSLEEELESILNGN